jgi:hypothetical protein
MAGNDAVGRGNVQGGRELVGGTLLMPDKERSLIRVHLYRAFEFGQACSELSSQWIHRAQ